MADKKISELDAIGALTGSNPIFPLVQGGNTLQINASALAVYTSQWSTSTASFNTLVSNQNAVNLGISNATGSLIGITNGLMAFTAALDSTYATDEQLLQLYQATSSIHSTTASLNTFTSSQNSVNLGISIVTGSLNSQTASQDSVNLGISIVTGSLNSQTASQDSVNLGISIVTGSLNEQTASQDSVNLGISIVTGSLNSQTASQDSVNLGISIVTGSLNEQTASQDSVNLGISIVTGSLNEQTASQDSVNLGISEVTSSLNSYTSSNESWKDGVRGEISGLEAYTASLKGAIEVNGQDVNVLGMITAQQFNVTYVSSSTMYQSGSTKFGDTSDDRHEFTGSVDINDSLVVQNGASGSFSGSFEGYVYTSKNGVAETTLEGDVITVKSLNDSYVASFPRFRVESYDTTKFGYFQLQPWNGEVYIVSNDGLNLESNTGRVKVTGSLFVNDSVEAVNLTGSLLSTNGVVSSSNQLFELNEQTGSQDSINLGISIVTGSLNEQTGSQDGVNFGISVFTSSIRDEVNGIEEYTASLKSAFTVIESMVDFNSSITASVVSSSYVKFDSLPNGLAPSYQEGLLYYDNDMGSLTFYNNEADISLQIGQENYVRAINVSGDDILNGTPVRVSGSQGDRVKIYKAEAFIHTGSYNDSEAHNHILGIATHDILDTETGYITISGLVKGINTDIYEAGDILYVQTGSAGVLTNVAPPFPYDKIQVGVVGRKHATVGEVLVLPKEPTHFGNITGLSGSLTTEVGDLWVYKSNNAWATSKTLEGDYIITGSTTINNVLKLEAADSLLSTGVEAGMIMASASYGFTNLYMYDGSEWKWLVTGSIS